MATDFLGGVGDAVSSVIGGIGEVAGAVLGATVAATGAGVQGFGSGIAPFLVGAAVTNPNLLISQYRSAGIPFGAEPNYNYTPVSASFSTSPEEKDWRVRISCPIIDQSPVMRPLQKTNGMVFPFTPSITMSHSAQYSTIDVAHTNYPFYAYKNSQVDEISISGKFAVQDQYDAQYWLAMMHFLRTVTKMYFGQGPNLGNPPPICTLNGYGDFVYNNVSCVVKKFDITLPNDVDYVVAQQGSTVTGKSGENVSYVPTVSDVSVSVQVIYSREKIKTFNLDAFSKGQLVVGSDGKGFI